MLTEFEYGPDGQAVIERTSSSTRIRFLEWEVELQGDGTTLHDSVQACSVMVGGSVVAQKSLRATAPSGTPSWSAEWHYFVRDVVGSMALVTDESGAVTYEQEYSAFGAKEYTSGMEIRTLGAGYTGHHDLPEHGLISMKARLYDPRLARFINPDPIMQAPQYSQNSNRYSYVYSNPLKFVDPDGRRCYAVEVCSSGGGGDEFCTNQLYCNSAPSPSIGFILASYAGDGFGEGPSGGGRSGSDQETPEEQCARILESLKDVPEELLANGVYTTPLGAAIDGGRSYVALGNDQNREYGGYALEVGLGFTWQFGARSPVFGDLTDTGIQGVPGAVLFWHTHYHYTTGDVRERYNVSGTRAERTRNITNKENLRLSDGDRRFSEVNRVPLLLINWKGDPQLTVDKNGRSPIRNDAGFKCRR